MNDTVDAVFLQKFAELLEIDPNHLTEDFLLSEYANWDSLAKVCTIALFDQQYNQIVNTEKLLNCKSFGDVLSLIEREVINESPA